ncbi:hypothetical protein SCHPADRAFT_992045 [Schizopora paradoxa]|uniref:YEATS domain-containing protein n=1 Tax=Schizopora paradoxa TaxID=27342 RepID=A0A0H2SFV3_9AGAM|nr:hypothetical protein SCHPADRAFT_992045 [Schizopora paradoxa]
MDCVGHFVPNYDFTTAVRDEVQLEIGIRTRLKQVIEARLRWAHTLKDALENEVKQEGEPFIVDSLQLFPTVAKDVHSTIESGCEFLFARQSIDETILQKEVLRASVPPPPESATGRLRNPPAFRQRPDKYDSKKELYICDPSSTPSLIYKIACADCGRADFPGVQGLLNHARLKHSVEYANHDACIQRCAVVVPEDEVETFTRNGIEITGMQASLRRLFEMALGASVGLLGEESTAVKQAIENDVAEAEAPGGSILTKTLGHHVDTPALAPFLGRAPKRRQINTYDEDDVVDVLGEDETNETNALTRWKMTYQKRSQGVDSTEDAAIEDVEDIAPPSIPHTVSQDVSSQTGSRFHITARVILSDWSLRLSDSMIKKNGGSVTHRWMLSVHSPSYSFHASTIISKVIIRPLTIPAPSGFSEPITITEPPFSAMGTADKPFLAGVTLEWAGSANKPTHLEHFVDMDLNHSPKPVLGDEQYVDVELDRNTVFLPRREDKWEMDWFSDSDQKRRADGSSSTKRAESNAEHIIRLKALLPRFPMTRKGGSLRTAPRVPYLLPQSAAHFLEMVPGRRKAIQWGRARAIWEAYCNTPTPAQPSENTISSPLDVYRWLEQEGHFPKPQVVANANASSGKGKEKATAETPELYCAVCGYLSSLHPQATTIDGRASPVYCILPEWMRRPPLLDAHLLRARNPIPKVPPRPAQKKLKVAAPRTTPSNRELATAVDPTLTLAVNRVASSLQLPCLKTWKAGPEGLHDADDLFGALGPSAVLALATKTLIRRLVDGGVRASEQQPLPPGAPPRSALPSSRKDKNSKQSSAMTRKRILTPAHIMQGVCNRSPSVSSTPTTSTRYDGMEALLVALGRLGTTEGLENLL